MRRMLTILLIAFAVGQLHSAHRYSANELVFLTRSGCVNTTLMRSRLDEALRSLKFPTKYSLIDLDKLDPSESRTRIGVPMRDNNILARHIKPAARKISVEFVNWQVLRRSFATWLKLAGADIKDAQALMRHSRALRLWRSISSTYRSRNGGSWMDWSTRR